ncbi:GDP-mannose 4,6-dehydratase [Mycoplasmatota bacterium]|nr:GDP-mannose 4,6-dehydratase [Mycoplasmatota bacterium]
MEKVIITGAAGFIGFHTAKKLLNENFIVIGIDNLNNYYDVRIKNSRLEILKQYDNFVFIKHNIVTPFLDIMEQYKPDYFINLAAQAGVRYSLENPKAYVDSNLIGFLNVLEACRHYPVKHLLYASSSSVYGGNKKIPFSEEDNVDFPVSLYAATKKSNELFAHSYSHLYNIPSTGLRFFTVYGPFGRPDMAYYSFTKNIIEGKPINVYNHGKMERDFTYIDDIVDGLYRLVNLPPSNIDVPYAIYNIGNNNPVNLMEFISILEKHIGKKAVINYMSMQPGDVLRTYADISRLENKISFKPIMKLDTGLKLFVNWYKDFNVEM